MLIPSLRKNCCRRVFSLSLVLFKNQLHLSLCRQPTTSCWWLAVLPLLSLLPWPSSQDNNSTTFQWFRQFPRTGGSSRYNGWERLEPFYAVSFGSSLSLQGEFLLRRARCSTPPPEISLASGWAVCCIFRRWTLGQRHYLQMLLCYSVFFLSVSWLFFCLKVDLLFSALGRWFLAIPMPGGASTPFGLDGLCLVTSIELHLTLVCLGANAPLECFGFTVVSVPD